MIKGALHIHSNVSPDSSLLLEQLKGMFKASGYSFIMTAEHAEDLSQEKYLVLRNKCAGLSDDTFLVIPGLEIKWKDKVHFLAYGAKEYMANENSLSLCETAKKIKEQTQCDFLVWGHFSHPSKLDYAKNIESLMCVEGIEIFNAGYHGNFRPDPNGLRALNQMGKLGYEIIPLGGLDMHRPDAFGRIYCVIEDLDMPEKDRIFSYMKKGKCIFRSAFLKLHYPPYSFGSIMFCSVAGMYIRYYRKIRNRASRLKNALKIFTHTRRFSWNQ
ncbi:MAG: hypothetical protein WC330_00830 [Candidatus Omnitrophota bacterium]|jgi:hypothetical protein